MYCTLLTDVAVIHLRLSRRTRLSLCRVRFRRWMDWVRVSSRVQQRESVRKFWNKTLSRLATNGMCSAKRYVSGTWKLLYPTGFFPTSLFFVPFTFLSTFSHYFPLFNRILAFSLFLSFFIWSLYGEVNDCIKFPIRLTWLRLDGFLRGVE